MKIVQLIEICLKNAPDAWRQHPVINSITYAVAFAFIMVCLVSFISELRKENAAKVILIIRLVLSVVMWFIIANIVVGIGDNLELEEAISRQLFIEFLVVAILAVILYGWIIIKRHIPIRPEEESDSFSSEIWERCIHAIWVVVFSGINALFGVKMNAFLGWGFSVFGKSIGMWLFSILYASVAVEVLVHFVLDLFYVPMSIIGGKRFVEFENAVSELIEELEKVDEEQ